MSDNKKSLKQFAKKYSQILAKESVDLSWLDLDDSRDVANQFQETKNCFLEWEEPPNKLIKSYKLFNDKFITNKPRFASKNKKQLPSPIHVNHANDRDENDSTTRSNVLELNNASSLWTRKRDTIVKKVC